MTQRKNTHQTHLESLVFLGQSGLEELNDKIEGMIDFLEDNGSRLNQTVKIDGSPALFCWSSYEGYPNNSIALKGFTKGPETALSSLKDIDKKYPSEDRAGMREMLKYGLEISKHIPKGECWQGDCLFTKDSKREENILGDDYITFQPNKIIYAFSEDNPGYDKIKNADFGICFHTIYTGEDKRQSFNVDVSRLDLPSNIYVMSPVLNVNRSKFNLGKIKTSFSRLEQLESDLLQTNEYEELVNNIAFMDYWNRFENASLADKKQTTIDIKTFLSDLVKFVEDKKSAEFEKKFASLKTEKGREKARSKYESELEELKQLIESNKSLLVKIVQTFNEAAKIKMFLWEGYKQSQMDYNTYYKSKTKGYIKGDMEGVAMSDENGNIVKIVDRSAFSSYNRDSDIESGWEHESLSEACLRREFNRLTEDETPVDPSKVLVFSFGKFNPPTIGHVKLAQAMANCDESSNKPVIYLSHKYDLDRKEIDKSQPLDYKEKVYWCKKAFGNLVDVVESNAQTAWEALHEINEKRPEIERIVFAGGDDRADGSMFANLVKSNGKQTSKPGGDFDFIGGLVPLIAGTRDERSSDLAETASSSLVRRMALENDFEKFKQLVPFDENDADELFDEIRDFYAANGVIREGLNEGQSDIVGEFDVESDGDTTRYKVYDKDPSPTRSNYGLIMGNDRLGSNWANRDVDKIKITGLNGKDSKYTGEFEPDSFTIASGGHHVKFKVYSDDNSSKTFEGSAGTSKTGKGFTDAITTRFQEVIMALIFHGDIGPDISKLLSESITIEGDTYKPTGVFELLNKKVFSSTEEFYNNWQQFTTSWAKALQIVYNTKSEFYSSLPDGWTESDIKHSRILHEYYGNGEFVKKNDVYDKADVYFCRNNNAIKALNNAENVKKYCALSANFVENKLLLGVSLKRPSGNSIVCKWDPEGFSQDLFNEDLRVVFHYTKSESRVKTVNLRFISKETENNYPILEVRSDGDEGNLGKSKFALQWKFSNTRKAWAGKGKEVFKILFSDNVYNKLVDNYIRHQDYIGAAKFILKVMGIDNLNLASKISSDEIIRVDDNNMNFRNNLVNFINLSVGYNGRDLDGNRITAPYIKVY